MRIGGLALAAVLLAPVWGMAAVANGGFLAFQQHDWAGAGRWWAAATQQAPGPQGEWSRLSAIAASRAGDPATAAQQAMLAVQAAPGAPLPLLQQGLTQQARGQTAAALASWRAAGAAPYFCTQAAQALYHATPPDAAQAVQAATVCTALDPTSGSGWLALGQAQAALGHDTEALAAFGPAYDTLLAAGQPGRAAVAAITAAGIAQRSGSDGAVTTWLSRARVLAPTVCADPARPQDPNLDTLCAHP
jgi:hypothetical protein